MVAETHQRLDKYLWFARIVKTRDLAQALVEAGQVRLNRVRVAKPGHDVAPGDHLTIALHGKVRVLKILALSPRRGPANAAKLLYEEIEAANGPM